MLSLPRHLHECLLRQGGRVVVTHVARNGSARTVRAAELAAAGAAMARRLDDAALAPRSLIGLVHAAGPRLHAAWLGVLWSGHVPTMIAPPSPRMEPRKYADGLRSILTSLDIGAIVIDGETRAGLQGLLSDHLPLVATDGLEPLPGAIPIPPDVDLDAEVVVQHTSGTTGAQKAISFTSRQIMTHAAAFAERLLSRSDDVVVSWLPLYHDMGFIACFVHPLVSGTPIVEMSAFDWVQSPALLFDAITAHGGTLCWLPNFAFKVLSEPRLLAQAAESGRRWDLGGVRAFISCSEPVSAGAIGQFVTSLVRYGVRREQVIASYAMAENLFAVTQNEIGAPHERWFLRDALEQGRAVPAKSGDAAVALVSNGRAIATTRVDVRDPEGHPLPEGAIGQIHVAGTHLFGGYRRHPELTAQVLDHGCYATGDLGFLYDGELYVTGRSKDLIIIRGRNYYPHDIEEIVGQVDGVNPGRLVAFGVPDEAAGTERLVVMLELLDGFDDRREQVALAVRRHVAQSLDCTVGDLRIVPPRTLVKSTSGKPARADNRQRYLAMAGAG